MDLESTEDELSPQLSREIFFQAFGTDFEKHAIVSFMTGPSQDNTLLGICFLREGGKAVNVAIPVAELETFAKFFTRTWVHMSQQAILEDAPKGNA